MYCAYHNRSPTLTKHSTGDYLIIVLVHTSVISLQDELFLEVNVALILNVLRKPLLWAVGQIKKREHNNVNFKNNVLESTRSLWGPFSIMHPIKEQVQHTNPAIVQFIQTWPLRVDCDDFSTSTTYDKKKTS